MHWCISDSDLLVLEIVMAWYDVLYLFDSKIVYTPYLPVRYDSTAPYSPALSVVL